MTDPIWQTIWVLAMDDQGRNPVIYTLIPNDEDQKQPGFFWQNWLETEYYSSAGAALDALKKMLDLKNAKVATTSYGPRM